MSLQNCELLILVNELIVNVTVWADIKPVIKGHLTSRLGAHFWKLLNIK